MQQDMAEKYVIVRGFNKVVGTLFFDSEQEAQQYINNTAVRPNEFRAEKYENFTY